MPAMAKLHFKHFMHQSSIIYGLLPSGTVRLENCIITQSSKAFFDKIPKETQKEDFPGE
jgi:hypothetical protein